MFPNSIVYENCHRQPHGYHLNAKVGGKISAKDFHLKFLNQFIGCNILSTLHFKLRRVFHQPFFCNATDDDGGSTVR